MQIRTATAADAARIADLATELGYPSLEDEIAERLRILLTCGSHFIAVAENATGLVGWVAAERRLLLESGARVDLVGLIVAPTARRCGTGKALVAAAEEWAASQQVRTISVRSNVARLESPVLRTTRLCAHKNAARLLEAVVAMLSMVEISYGPMVLRSSSGSDSKLGVRSLTPDSMVLRSARLTVGFLLSPR